MIMQDRETLQCAVTGQEKEEWKKSQKAFILLIFSFFLLVITSILHFFSINKEGAILQEWDLAGRTDSFVPWYTLH